MSEKKSFFHHAMIYWLGRMVARSLQIVLLPIFTAYLSPADYGELSILGISMDAVALVLSFQLPVAIYKFWVKEETEEGRQRVLGSAMLVTMAVPTLLLLPVYVWADSFSSLLGMQSHANLLRLALIEGQLGMVITVIMTEMRVRDESRRFSLWELSQRVGIGLMSVLLVAGFGMGIWGMFIAHVIVFGCITLWLLPPFLRQVGLHFDLEIMRKMFRYALPLVPSAVAMAAVHSADRFFLQRMVGLEATGLYAIGYKFGMLVNILVLGPFLLIWQPKRITLADDHNAAEKYGQIFTYLFALTSFVAVALTGLAKETVQIMTAPAYWQSYSLVSMVAWSYVFFALSSVVSVGLFVHHKTATSAWIVFLAFAANMLGNFLLIPHYGAYGAALSTLVSFVLLFLGNLLLSHRYIAIAYEVKKIVILSAHALLCMALMIGVSTGNLLLDIVIKSSLLLCFPLSLYLLGFFDALRIPQRIVRAWCSMRERMKVGGIE
ncbi:lipopolysaccharide biosynthesis protein [Thiovibrio sp. JS02]